MKVIQFIKKLRKMGVEIIEGRGKVGHCLAKYKGKQATVPIHGKYGSWKYFSKKICKQLGLDYEKIL